MTSTELLSPSRLSIEVEEGVELPQMFFAIRTITPEIAAGILDIPVRNRRVSQQTVMTYASDMSAGRWEFTPEPIILDEHGGALDGQHRLRAVVESEVGRVFLVVSNVDQELIDVLGIGRMRSVANVFGIRGEGNPEILAAAVRVLHHYLYSPDALAWGTGKFKLSAPGATQVLEEHPGLRDCVSRGRDVASKIEGLPAATVVGIYLTSKVVSIHDQQGWFGPLVTGMNLGEGSPILAFRDYMSKLRRARSGRAHTGSQIAPRAYLAAYLYAWQAWHEDRPLRRMADPKQMPEVGLPITKTTAEQLSRSKATSKVRKARRDALGRGTTPVETTESNHNGSDAGVDGYS